jgi:hypothetical protein
MRDFLTAVWLMVATQLFPHYFPTSPDCFVGLASALFRA